MKLTNRRLPGKNTKKFTNGEPLYHYILKTLKSVDEIDEIYVYCSDDQFKDLLPEGINFLKRSKSLDSDTTKINEVLVSFAKDLKADIYLLAHATAPFITSASISKGISSIMSGEHDSSFSVVRSQEFMWKNEKPMNYSLDAIPRTQDLDPIYIETCGFYCYTYDLIMLKNRRIGYNPKMIEVSQIESIDIDGPEDFILADAIFNHIISPTR